MSEVFANHPFQLLPTPAYQLQKDEKPDEFTNAATQMACAHNVMIRALNAIYLQAMHIRSDQEQAFLSFAHMWYKAVEHHHRTEEVYFFPLIEKMAAEKGVMQKDTEQHDAFQPGLKEYKDYIERCLSAQENYSGKELVRILDGFAPILWQHLADEIPSFISLRRYGDKLEGFHARLATEAKETETELGILAGAVFLMVSHDVDYENGIHTNFPPIPAPITWGLRNLAWWAHRDWWAFAPCDSSGKMRPLDIPSV